MAVVYPNCELRKVDKCNYATKAGAGIGAAAGSVTGYVGAGAEAAAGAEAGLAVGAFAGTIGAVVGATAGGIAGGRFLVLLLVGLLTQQLEVLPGLQLINLYSIIMNASLVCGHTFSG